MKARVTILFVVPIGYLPGEYAKLHANDGEGNVDWKNPASRAKLDLVPRGAGIYGFGRAPFGRHRFGKAHSMRCAGFGHLPFGKNPFGHGTAVVSTRHTVPECGYWKFALACYDSAGNLHEGTPEEVSLSIHVPPPAPTGLKKNNYNKTTDVLTLDVA